MYLLCISHQCYCMDLSTFSRSRLSKKMPSMSQYIWDDLHGVFRDRYPLSLVRHMTDVFKT